MAWTVTPGDFLSREDRRLQYGGAPYGGIEPSAKTPNVFVYSDPSRGEAYGYNFDGWDEGGSHFLYTGEGTKGDQEWREGNAAILGHKERGRALRLFVADGVVAGTSAKNHRYIGEFEIDDEWPFFYDTAPDVDHEPRRVIVFRLRPVGDALRREDDESDTGDAAKTGASQLVAPEAHAGDEIQLPGTEPSTAERRESAMVKRFEKWLDDIGHEAKRWKLTPPNAVRALATDTYDVTDDELYEAKGSSRREAVRMIIGQLYDYRMILGRDDIKLSALLPSRPSDDLVALLHRAGIACVYETVSGTFERLDP